MAKRGLKASLKGIEQANKALARNVLNKKALALDLGIARSTVHNFFSSKPIDRLNFEEICKRLGLDWEDIADIPASEPRTEQVQDTTINDNNFVGREEAIAHLDKLVNEGAKVILIHAEGGIGKTTLATKWFELRGLEYLELRVGNTPYNLNSVKDWVRLMLRDYFKINPEQNFITMLEQFKSKLKEEKIGLLIDNLESALINGGFIESHHSYFVELLTVLAHKSLHSITLITSREQVYEPTIKRIKTIKTYPLDGLNKKAWYKYFESYNINIDAVALSKIHEAYGGNAEAMFILNAEILKQFQGNLKTYWEQNHYDLLRHRSLKLLVQSQFKKLKKDELQAYHLICRLGYYFNQDYPCVPEIWLFCLMWDVPEHLRLRLVDALVERSLVKINSFGYYLHPVIRLEAVENLKLMPDSHDENLLFIKKEVDSLITISYNLQSLLCWINEKFLQVSKQYNKTAFRAFYLGFIIAENIENQNFNFDNDKYYYELACFLDSTFEVYCKTQNNEIIDSFVEQLGDLIEKKYSNFILSYIKKNSDLFRQSIIREYKKINKQIIILKILEIVLEKFHNEIFKLFIDKIEGTQEYINILANLSAEIISKLAKKDFIDAQNNNEINIFRDISCGIKQSFTLRMAVMSKERFKLIFKKVSKAIVNSDESILQSDCYFCFRNIEIIDNYIFKFPFTEEDKKLLKQYYDANKLLVHYLKSNNDVTSEVRSHIEDTLLLPITEIEKRPFKN
ncbi:MAG: NACHT C-terminal helical domain 2-containing protein [Nostoc sp. SerVER01]|nr:ATP-binding protein [Nostoc sp. SerVER01]